VNKSIAQNLTERCDDALAFMQRRTDVQQVKIYVRGGERDKMREDSSLINHYGNNGLVVRYEQGRLDEDFIIFERK